MKVARFAICVVAFTRYCVDAASVDSSQNTRDLQGESSAVAVTLQDAQAQITTCSQCRSADEMKQAGLFRTLFGHLMAWWFNRQVNETRFVSALKSSKINVDPSQWTDISQKWTANAQMLRQRDEIGSDASTSSSSSDVILQYEHLLTDLTASSLEAASTLMNQAGFEKMNEAVPLDYLTCRFLTMTDFVNRVLLPNIAILGDALNMVSSGGAVEESAVNAGSSLIQELLDNSTSPILERYSNALLTSCAENDGSFVALQETAESLILDLTEKKNAVLLFSANQVLSSISTQVFTDIGLIPYIQNLVVLILRFPVIWFLYVPVFVLYFASSTQSFQGVPPVVLAFLGVGFILALIILFPFAYIYTIAIYLLSPLEGIFAMRNTVDEMLLLKQNPFLASVDDVECQMQKISCQSDAFSQQASAQVLALSP